ncbi:hypothetical protein PGT21_007349 [Puccinia graminis f. sp. tritici]|uniref:Uncharacterized protein n=2 Tax=Puccinia graminis f. sp. tritici TaxID=56615 RepID=A0A5B0NUD2_PUCGR|nr:hypothetical protein PGT21_007349 [Puccinia graminis f. sp. tritici]
MAVVSIVAHEGTDPGPQVLSCRLISISRPSLNLPSKNKERCYYDKLSTVSWSSGVVKGAMSLAVQRDAPHHQPGADHKPPCLTENNARPANRAHQAVLLTRRLSMLEHEALRP